MILKDIVSLLANRINQPRVIECYLRKVYTKGYDAGTKQSPWISAEERLPEYNTKIIIYHEYRFYVGFMYYSMKSNWWRVSEDERTDMIVNEDDFWTPIPSFDEILEVNKDVLERIKEKGD